MTGRPPPASRAGAPYRALALLILPALALWIGGWFGSAIGAHWIGPFYDPDYAYLFNSLNIAEAASPRHTDHPGTTVQELGALVLRARALFGAGPPRAQTLSDPESVLNAMSWVMRALHAAALVALGAAARRATGSLVAAVASQLASVLSVIGLATLWRAEPEPLTLAISTALAATMLAAVTDERGPSARLCAMAGVLCGLGLATKATFLPVCIVPIWMARSRRSAAILFGSAAGALVVSLLPIATQLPRVGRWLLSIFLADGKQGVSHGHLIIDPTRFVFSIRLAMWQEPVAIAAAAAGALLLLHRLTLRNGSDARDRRAAAALACAAVAVALQYLMVAKHPGAHYLVPALPLAGLITALATLVLRAYSPRERRAACLAGITALAAGALLTAQRLTRERLAARKSSDAVLAVRAQAVEFARRDDAMLATMYGSTSPVWARYYGDLWAGSRCREDLGRRFTGEVIVDEVTHDCSLNGRPLSRDEVIALAREGRLLFQGPQPVLPTYLSYQTILDGNAQGIYKAVPPP